MERAGIICKRILVRCRRIYGAKNLLYVWHDKGLKETFPLGK